MDKLRELEDEIYDLRRQESDRREEQQREMEARHKEHRHLAEQALRSATSWHDALAKQSYLMSREAGKFDASDPEEAEGMGYFAQGALACDRALALWGAMSAARQAEREQLMQALANIDLEIRYAVADKLKGEATTQGWQSVAVALLGDDMDFEQWLDW